jgi:AcrR family transcriptional regulator
MAHEVVKHVGGRAYRYSVESYRDAASGKVRGRWTYLGKADVPAEGSPDRAAAAASGRGPQVSPARRARRPAETRERLLAAFERLVDAHGYPSVTAGAVAKEAGVAHGTFYRHFPDKGEALRAALMRAREVSARARPSFDGPVGAREAERKRVRDWITAVLRSPFERRGLLGAWYDARDPELQALRRRLRDERIDAMAAYFRKLDAAGLVRLGKPRGVATTLVLLIDGLLRAIVVGGETLEEGTVEGILMTFDRAIFQA